MVSRSKLFVGLMVLMAFSDAYANQSTYGDCSSNIEGLQQGGTVILTATLIKGRPKTHI